MESAAIYILAALASLYALATILAATLPPRWRITIACARVAADLLGIVEASRRPPPPPPPVLPLLLLVACLGGCSSWSLTGARASVPRAPAPLDPTCDAISREQAGAQLGAGILGGMAGAGGLASIPVDDDGWRKGLAGGSAVSGVGAAGMLLWSQERAARFERRCGQ